MAKHSAHPLTPAPPFVFSAWIRLHAPDLIMMALMGALGLGLYESPPAPSRSFPVYFRDGEVVYPEFAYPLRKEVVPIYAAALIAFFVPFFFFLLFQIRRRSMDDLLTTTMGLLKSLITAAVFQVFIKTLIGGLRPHFLAVCKPSIQPGDTSGNGFGAIMYDRTICAGDKDQIDDSLESMPSGHSTAGFAGLIYLALYFNAQLKVMSAHNPAYWKMCLFFAPILGAVLIAGALTIDEFHHWYDVVAGGIIGTTTAFVAFRQTFASIFDFRFNHMLLPRTTSLFHRQPYFSTNSSGAQYPFFTYSPSAVAQAGQWSTVSVPFTREGGWGWVQEASVGAPGDATALGGVGGTGMGMGGGALGGGGVANGGHDPLGRAEAGMMARH